MAKSSAVLLTLRRDREQPFRRTVSVGKKGDTKQLVFEPGVDLELEPELVAQVQDLIDNRMIVPADRDEKGRLRVSRSAAAVDNSGEVEALKARLAERDTQIADLQKQVDELNELLDDDDGDDEGNDE